MPLDRSIASRQTKPLSPSAHPASLVNALTIDVEGFIESNRESFPIPEHLVDEKQELGEIERNMEAVLSVLDESDTRATFFFVGTVAHRLPTLVKEVARLGHEIGSHGVEHRRLFGLTPGVFGEGIRASKHELEDLSGSAVGGFRAPDFSLTRATEWALDILREEGFQYDSSVYPIGIHDVYGIRGADPFVFRWPNGLVEFPLSTIEVLRWRLPFGGGGYFRLYPLAVTERCIASTNHRGHPAMFYIHPYEVGPVIPRVPRLSPHRRFRHYYRARDGAPRLRRLLKRFRFAPAVEVLRGMGAIDG